MNQQWIPRMQQCELRLSEMEQQIKDLKVTRGYLRRESDMNLNLGTRCATLLCQLSAEINDALARPVPQAIPLIRGIAQRLDQECLSFEADANVQLIMKDNRRAGMLRAQQNARNRETFNRQSQAPGGNI